jgi:iron complex transport system substrate-binding protein
MRIVSLLASGTELACALGAGDELVGRSHECDHPPWVRRLPALSRPTFDVSGSSAEIDRAVRARLQAGEPLYEVDQGALQALAPDVIISQTHCEVCAVTPRCGEGTGAMHPGHTVALETGTLEGILAGFLTVADRLGRRPAGERLVAGIRARLDHWRAATAALPRPRVICLEWIDPPFAMGNWGPELVTLAGGQDLLGTTGAHSAAVTWDAIRAADPEVLVVAPCGFDLVRTRAEMPALAARPGWGSLRAVRAGRVHIADGNLHFNRSGPTLFDSIEVLAEILHPAVFAPGHRGVVWEPFASVSSPG